MATALPRRMARDREARLYAVVQAPLGVRVDNLDEYVDHNGRIRLLILHGDQFDTFTTAYPWLTEIACGIFYYIQKWMPHRAARWVRRISKRWYGNSQLIERRAVEYARNHGYRDVTCGHTHLPMTSEHDGVFYVNSGTWTEAPPCPFVVVSGGEVRLEHWPMAGVENEILRTVSLRSAFVRETLPPALPAMG